MADLDPVRPGDPLSAKKHNGLLATVRGLVRAGGLDGVPGMGQRSPEALLVHRARITKLVSKQTRNITDEGTPTDEQDEHNAVLLMYDPQTKKWQDRVGGEITVILSDDGYDDEAKGFLPMAVGAKIAVYYSKSAQAYFPMHQPKTAIIHVTTSEADPNQTQSAETAYWDGSQWAILQDVRAIRIGV